MVVSTYRAIMDKVKTIINEPWSSNGWITNECYLWNPKIEHIVTLSPVDPYGVVQRIDLYPDRMEVFYPKNDHSELEIIPYNIPDDALFQLTLVINLGDIDRPFIDECIEFRNYMINYK